MSNSRILCLFLYLFLAAFCGCGKSTEKGVYKQRERSRLAAAPHESGAPRGTLVIGMQQEPEILNDAINSMVASVYVCNLIFSKFVKNDDNLALVPDLIEEIPTVENGAISPDHLTYTYRIRKNAKWHDGVPVTSADAEFSYRVMMDPDINVESRQGWDVIERVETPDSHTVVFHLKEVYANFVGDCFYDESVLPKHLLEHELGGDFQRSDFHRHPVGSGPFVLKEWQPGSHIVLEANRNYYGSGPFLEKIIVKFVPDGNALLMQLETGEIQAIDNAPNTLLAAIERLKGVRLYRNPALFLEHLDLNCENPILQDVRVRRALALATDRKEISEKIYRGVWEPAFGEDHPRSPYYDSSLEKLWPLNLDSARRILSSAGWRDEDGDGVREKNGERLKLKISSTTGNLDRERTELVLREQYSRIGVSLEIRNYHPSQLYASWDEGGVLRRGNFDIALYAELMPPDLSTKLGTYSADYIPPRGRNFTRIQNERLTRLLEDGSRAVDMNLIKSINSRIMEILSEEVPSIPLLWVTQIDCMPKALENYRPNPTQSGDTWNANEWRFRGEER